MESPSKYTTINKWESVYKEGIGWEEVNKRLASRASRMIM